MRPPVWLVHSHFTFTSCEIHHCGWQFMTSRLIRCQDHIISSRDFIWNNSAHYSVVVYDGNVVTDRISCSHFQCSRWPIPALWWHNATFSVVGSTVQSMIDSQTVDDRHPDSRWQNPLHCVVDDRLDGELVPRVTGEEPEDGVTSSANLRKRNQLWLGANHKKEWKILIYSAKWSENWKHCTSIRHKVLLTSARRASLGFLGLKGPCFFACSTWAVVIKIIMHLHL